MTAHDRPEPDTHTRPFWDGLRDGMVTMPRCRACGHIQFPPGPCCSQCLAEEFAWELMSGRGHVVSYVVYHHAYHRAFADKLPYNVAVVALDEGPRLLSNIIGIPADGVVNGMRVVAECTPEGDVTLLRFRPAE